MAEIKRKPFVIVDQDGTYVMDYSDPDVAEFQAKARTEQAKQMGIPRTYSVKAA